ncbi:hypothetical protein JOB18_004569 [Solea senegalensis]|uniref:Uncharacterized protein n=1 Tax=Solea senegalensis TaxID=28829 RepID=A0AAV6S1E0_SOLSE|nr:hypothetical protein JOB18_004569 [Solea senegalensis]
MLRFHTTDEPIESSPVWKRRPGGRVECEAVRTRDRTRKPSCGVAKVSGSKCQGQETLFLSEPPVCDVNGKGHLMMTLINVSVLSE